VQATESPKIFAAWLTALFLVVLGAKLWVVQLFGSPLPMWDQWDEALTLFRPWMEGHLTWRDFFTPNNEHRIVLTKLMDLALIQLNGRWEPLLQMTLNAFIHTAFAGALATALWNFFGRKNGWLICFLVVPFFSLPFAAENTIWAINSQHYLMSLCALGTILGLGFGKVFNARWWLGLAAAFAGLLSMASGFLATTVVGALLILRALKDRRMEKINFITLAVCLGVNAFGCALKVSMPDDAPLRAHTAGEFFIALAHNFAWPFLDHTEFFWIVPVLPLAALLVFYFQKKFVATRAAELLFALALWSGLQSAALAYGRANYGDGIPASRYMDALAIFALAGIFSVLLLAENFPFITKPFSTLLPLAFAGIIFFQMGKVSALVVEIFLPQIRTMNLIAEERVETFLATHDEKEFLTPPTARPDPVKMLAVLKDEKVRAILPAACQSEGQRSPPYRFQLPVVLLLENAPLILGSGWLLFAALCGIGVTRGALGLVRENYAGIIALFVALTAVGFVWSRGNVTRRGVEFELQTQLANYFQQNNQPVRAATHAAKAEKLKP
jgi:hypothetical protein